MKYDVQIGNELYRELTYAELISYPIKKGTYVRRENSDWINAEDCVELTHVIINSTSESANPSQGGRNLNIANIVNDLRSDVENNSEDLGYESDRNQDLNVSREPTQRYHEEERIFIPTAEYFKCKQKRKAAIIGVLTLGLAGLSLVGVGNIWRGNIFEGTSFSAIAGLGFVFKCLSFIFCSMLLAIPYFIYSVFALIYYSVKLKKMRN